MDKKYYIIGGVLIVLLLVAGALFFTSGSKPKVNSSGKIELTWWKTFEDSQNIQDLISDYQATHKNVTINFVKKDPTTFEHDLVNAIASGSGPDIFSIHNDWLPKYSTLATPMPAELMSVRTYQETFANVVAGDFIKDSKIYGLSLAVDVLALYYNKDLLGSAGISQPPATWPELVANVQKLTRLGQSGSFASSGIALGTSSNVNRAVDILSLLMLQNGTEFYSPGMTNAMFDRSQNISTANGGSFNPGSTALAFYTQFADPAKTSYTWNTKSDLSIDSFTQGKVAMMLNYWYSQPMIISRSPNLNWGAASVPQTSEDAIKVNFANYWAETVSKSSKNSATAWDFLNFITQKSELTKYYAKHKLVSSRKDILASQGADPDIGVFAESALTAKSVYKKDANVFESTFSQMIDDVVLHNLTPDEAIRNAVQKINLNLQKQ